MMLDSIDNGPLVYPTIEEDGQTQPKKYSELTEAQQLQDDCDVQATNIILHDLPPDVYALVNHQEAAKDIWDKVKLLMKGTELSYQERECRLYNLFDKFASIQGEILYEYYWRFSQLISDMHTIRMTMQQVQTEDLDAYNSDCDDLSSANAVLMANLSSCDSDVLSKESQDSGIQDTNSSALNDFLVLSLVEQMTDHVANLDMENQTNKMLKHSNYNPDTSVKSHTPVRIEAPSELPKVSLVNKSLKKLKYQLASFDKIVIKRTTFDAITADEINEVQTIFNQMEATVDQCFVDKNAFEIQIKQLSIDNDQLLKQIMSQEIVHIAVNYVDILNVNNIENELKKLKEKNVVDTAISKSIVTIAPRMFKLDIKPISHRLKNNKDAHETCPSLTKPCEKSVVVTPMNKDKKVRISNSLDPTQSGGSTVSDVPSSSPNDCRFGNDHIAKIMGYGDYQIGNVTISKVYYVEGLGLVQGLPKLKYQKDHLCSACALGKSKKQSHKPKYEDSIQEKLYLLHMDLCRPMRIQSINGRKYILVIVDGYSRTDNGTEFVNQTLRAYYEEVEISHQTFVARTTQQMELSKDETVL
ncbi:retrovirus-related pol polyprotein from transposon TNT 1-94 [Tanacetum coccineum]